MAWRTFLLVLLSSTALAQTPAVRAELTSFVVQQDPQSRREGLLSEKAALPGDVVLWKATAVNGGPTPLHDLDVTVPIPSSTRYVEGSAAPLTLGKTRILPRFSFDGGRNFGFAPLKKRVVTTEGGRRLEKEVEVRPDEYTHVRWSIPTLDARSKAEVTLRTRVR